MWVLYKSGTRANKLINCYYMPPPPNPLPLPISIWNSPSPFLLMLDLAAKFAVFPLIFISRLPLLEPYLLFFVVIARETMMLDRFMRGQNKQTTITLHLRFMSPTLLARGRDPLTVRKFRQKNSASTRMEYVEANLMNCYSPVSPSYPRPFRSPFDCCISPLSTPILLRIL